MSGQAAFGAIAASCLRQITANEACARVGTDIEGVHQFRIGLRRLRALVGAFPKLIAPDLGSYLAPSWTGCRANLPRHGIGTSLSPGRCNSFASIFLTTRLSRRC